MGERTMHDFGELVDGCTHFTLNALEAAQQRAVDGLNERAATAYVKALQAVTLQKAIMAVGMISLFEAMLQDRLNCTDGFKEAGRILSELRADSLGERFTNLQQAINVLKHGHGRSYEALLAKATTLPFLVRAKGEPFFFEGDVSEISTLVMVDDNFVKMCSDVIREVSVTLRRAGHRI
jgi:hypothetical protein